MHRWANRAAMLIVGIGVPASLAQFAAAQAADQSPQVVDRTPDRLFSAGPNPVPGGSNASANVAVGEDAATNAVPGDVLSPGEWRRVDRSVDRALTWLASQQLPDGSFPSIPTGQPGVTSLCMMAFASHGHVPGEGLYGERLERAVDFVIGCQKENGLLALVAPEGARIDRNVHHEIGTCSAYNHAISSLVLSEFYGMSEPTRARRIQAAIERALATSLEMQRWPKKRATDLGGWRYVHDPGQYADSDLSITGWELMFLRSARNAGFDVPKQPIDDAVAYVRRCYSRQYGAFQYIAGDNDHRSRGMAGAGILALAHAGFHNAPETKKAGDWILEQDFDQYNVVLQYNPGWPHDRYHYALLNCCQGMYQLGGRHWEEFYPRIVRIVLANQRADGSWPVDSHWHDGQFGSAYTTALVVVSLGAPNQLLPKF